MSNVTRWNPFREIAAMQNAMDRIFDDALRGTPLNTNNLPIDAHESDEAYTLIANVPGVPADHIDVNVHDGTLTINVTVEKPQAEEGTRELIQERFYGKMSRSFSLPQKIDVENVEASYDEGVLTLRLPKAPEAKPRQINIKSGNLIKSQN
jgi:HSP20 family protein